MSHVTIKTTLLGRPLVYTMRINVISMRGGHLTGTTVTGAHVTFLRGTWALDA